MQGFHGHFRLPQEYFEPCLPIEFGVVDPLEYANASQEQVFRVKGLKIPIRDGIFKLLRSPGIDSASLL
jgi:hypothetical protein